VVDLCVQFPDPYFKGPEDPVLIPKLRHARFRYRGGQSICKYFDMPVLQSLSYDQSDYFPIIELPGSLPQLKILRVRVTGGDETGTTFNFREMLEGYPELTEIFIDMPYFNTQELITSLIPSEGHLPIGTKLEVFRLGRATLDEHDYDNIRKMIEFRFRSDSKTVSRMREFTLYDPQTADWLRQEMEEASRAYMDEGLAISVESKGGEEEEELCDCGGPA
jgi:hypothetical protein